LTLPLNFEVCGLLYERLLYIAPNQHICGLKWALSLVLIFIFIILGP
jgi:hypothetical protein